MTNATVIPLRPEEVPKDLVCAVCLSVPLEPSILRKCSHVFCTSCIFDSLSYNDTGCPVCRRASTASDIQRLSDFSPFAHRIWSNISVKCDGHEVGCSWTGSISDYERHKMSCRTTKNQSGLRRRSDSDQELLDFLEIENERMNEVNGNLRQKLERMRVANAELKEKLHMAEEANVNLRENWTTMAGEFAQLKNMVKTCVEDPIPNEKGGYSYDRNSVVRLTKLICQNLENKPAKVRSHKIFECIRNIFMDLRKNYADNPNHLYMDVRMLFGVCLASATWFTDKQMSRLREMAAENGWA
eukprot:jgi/Psemu1/291697/fgenesh1_pg.779_\